MKDEALFIAGHKGLVGSALLKEAKSRGYKNILTKSHSELDLSNREDVFDFFRANQPKYVFLSAAKVGGIHGNNTYPVEFLLENLKIQNNVIEACHVFGVKKLIFLGSSCIYPKLAPQPIKEECLLSGKLEPTNEAYSIAKITGIKLCEAFNRQYGANFISVMPCNLYGPNDNYHTENAHALPMLLRRFHDCKLKHSDSVEVWGTGSPKREFLYSSDLADGCFFILENLNAKDVDGIINIGYGVDITISELAKLMKSVVKFEGKIEFNPSRPDGTARKLLDTSKLAGFGWKPKISLEEGIRLAYNDYLSNPNLRK